MSSQVPERANNIRPAIVLLSGGLDSTTCLAIAASAHAGHGKGATLGGAGAIGAAGVANSAIRHANGAIGTFAPIRTLAFDYGQRHRHELAAAARISKHFGAAEHRVVQIDLRAFGGSALTADIAVPKDRDESQMSAGIPVTYVPARNTIFLSYALAWADVLRCDDVFIGVNALDYSGYPDCRPEYIEAFQAAARLGTRRPNFTIHAPLVSLTKAQIIRRGVELGVDYSMTHSCYDPDPRGRACGHCDSCLLRKKGFAEAGVPDPTTYAT